MELRDSDILILGGAGLVGQAVARRLLTESPASLMVTSLYREEAEQAAAELQEEFPGSRVTSSWGDLFVPESDRRRSRSDVLADDAARRRLVDDLFGELTDDVFRRSALGTLLGETRPGIIVDCINTAGALAYQNAFASAAELRRRAEDGDVDPEVVERHLATLYLPQLIRHVQIALEGMKRAETEIYVKIGTAGTGGMGLNIPFTHSEERPSRMLLAKSGLAGAHTLFLYLMARTPGAPAVKEIKPTAAISWKSIGYGLITRGGKPMLRGDATEALSLSEAFGDAGARGYVQLDDPLEGVYLDAGENGFFSMSEFETLTSLGLMEYVTPEEIAQNVYWEIRSHPTGKDVVAALDAATMGPTYRAGTLRSEALRRMEEMERDHGVRAVAFEMLGPPRLSKLLFEGAILERLFGEVSVGAELDPEETARRARALIEEDGDLRQRIVSIGLPILLPSGNELLRGPKVKVPPEGDLTDGIGDRLLDRGWVDLRPENWRRWKERFAVFRAEVRDRPGLEKGSQGDHQYGDRNGRIRPGRMCAWILRYEDKGERIKR